MKLYIVLIAILVIAAFFRFFAINWDQDQHLHPDERFLTMVATDMKVPHSFADYLNPATSLFNPANINHKFYVYGTFPVVINKLLAQVTNADNYGDITLQGRLLSGLADLLIVFLIFKTLLLFERRYKLHAHIKYWGAFFYAIAVLPIQLSHFFAVDTFLNCFIFASFYFALRFYFHKNRISLIMSALFLGLAIGSKISAIYIIPLLAFFIIKAYTDRHTEKKHHALAPLFVSTILYLLTVYVVGRLADPYLFESSNFFDPRVSTLFLENLRELKTWGHPESWFPPAVQWVNKLPVFFALSNLVIFGVGLVYAIFAVIGGVVIATKYKRWELIFILLWVVLFFLYQSIQFSKTMRYFLPLYPFLAIFAGIGFYELTKHWSKIAKTAVIFTIVLWPMMFFSIYTKDHSRTTASKWIYQYIPSGSVLLSEHWDDSLPIMVDPTSQKTYTHEQLPVFGADNPEKWQQMDAMLARGDYLVLSSNRGWGSIPSVPKRYPRMIQYYEDLFADRTAYKKVAEFTSYPSLTYLGIPLSFPDDWAEEAFTVYDHPKVMIFQKTK